MALLEDKLYSHEELESAKRAARQEAILEMVGQHFMLPEEKASRMIEKIREEGRQETFTQEDEDQTIFWAQQKEQKRILALIEQTKATVLYSLNTGTNTGHHDGWNQALDSLKDKILGEK